MNKRRQQAFTIIELMVVVAVLAVLALIAAPSLKDFMLVQRLKGINAQLVTDMQFARSEAVARNSLLRVVFRANATMTCYSLYTSINNSVRCDCQLGAGAACGANASEVRTVQIPLSQSVKVLPAGTSSGFAFDHVTGAIYSIPTDNFSVPITSFVINTSIDATRTLSTTVARSGRPTVCASTTNLGAPPC
jgi:type IV fimbrial biogenesis protein FimT